MPDDGVAGPVSIETDGAVVLADDPAAGNPRVAAVTTHRAAMRTTQDLGAIISFLFRSEQMVRLMLATAQILSSSVRYFRWLLIAATVGASSALTAAP